MRRALACLVAVVATAAADAAPINLISNGEFENTSSPAFYFGPNAGVPGWQNSSGTIEIWSQSFGAPVLGSDGLPTGQHLEITTNGSNETVSQTLTVPSNVIGLATFSFDAWPRAGSEVSYLITGSVSGTILSGTTGPLDGNSWTPFSFGGLSLTPGETLTVTFQGIGGGSAGAHVDQVVLLANTPEPVSLLVFGGLVVGGGLVARKRLLAKKA